MWLLKIFNFTLNELKLVNIIVSEVKLFNLFGFKPIFLSFAFVFNSLRILMLFNC